VNAASKTARRDVVTNLPIAARTRGSTDRGAREVQRSARRRGDSSSDTQRCRVDVVAPSVVEAVLFAGGFMFDRVMAGWDVRALVTDDPDERPLQILGAAMFSLETELASADPAPRPRTLVVAGDLYASDGRVKRRVRAALDDPSIELALWGETPTELRRRLDVMRYQLSAAATVFKSHALLAADAPAAPQNTIELFLAGSSP
jgi:hypothetical protein